MGRYSDSEEEKKKRKKKKKKRSRSRSRSTSIDSKRSSKQKKSKKSKHKHRSRSRSYDKYRKSRSSSRGRRSRSRHRSRSLDRYRSRSRSYSRYSRSRSRDRYRRRSRSLSRGRSRSRERYRRSRETSRRSRSPSSRKDREKSEESEDPFASIPGFAQMTPSEQARIRMQVALKAAAAADEKIKGHSEESRASISLQDQMNFSQAIQDIESSGFLPASFKSNRGDKKDDKGVKDEFLFGTAAEMKLDPSQRKPVIVNVDTDELAHPNFYTDPEEKMDRWIQKLTNMRRKKLEGEAIS